MAPLTQSCRQARWLLFFTFLGSVTSRNALIKWLDRLTVKIPDQSFKASFVHLHIHNLVCTHFGIEHVQSDVSSNSELGIGVHNVSATCQGSYKTNIEFVNGDLTATVGAKHKDRNALEWRFRVIDNTTFPEVLKPQGVKTVHCQLGLAMTHLHFENGVSKLINLFHDQIEKAIDKQLACDKVQQLIDDKANANIAIAMRWLQPYIDGKAQERSVSAGSRISHHPSRFPSIFATLNDFVEAHLDKGFLPNATQCGGFPAGVNGLLEEHDHLSLNRHVTIHRSLPQEAHMSLRLSDWYLSGLSDWKKLSVLRPLSNGNFETHLTTPSNVSLSVQVELNITKPQSETLTETFDITIFMTAMEAKLAMELDVKDFVQIGSIAKAFKNLTSSLPCLGFDKINLLDAAVDVNLADVVLKQNISSSSPNKRHDLLCSAGLHARDCDQLLEEEIDELISNALAVIVHRYPVAATSAIAGLINGPAKERLNVFMTQALQNEANCTSENDPSHHWVNFSKTPLLWVNRGLNHSLASLNRFVDCTTGVVGDLMSGHIPGTVSVKNFGSFEELSVLQPRNDTLMSSSVIWGTSDLPPRVDASIGLPRVFAASAFIEIEGVRFEVDSFLEYDRNRFLNLDISNFLSQCAALPTEELSFPFIEGSVGEVLIVANVSLLLEGNRSVRFEFDSADFPDFSSTVQDVVKWSVQTVRDGSLWGSNLALRAAHKGCGEPGAGGNESQFKTNDMVLILSALFVLAQPFILFMKRSRHQNEASSDVQPDESADLVEPLLSLSPTELQGGDSYPNLMSQTGYVPRHMVPITICFTMGLFLASNISVGASVKLVSAFELPSLYDFGLVNTAEAMLKAKIYPLFLLVVLFSGVWPYVKLVLMLVAWVVPENHLSFQTREAVLTKLDALSKYSLVDTYVLVVMLVAFRYHLSFLDGDYSLDVYVLPEFGFYGFLLATMMSLIIGHVMVHKHRQSVPRVQQNASPGCVSVFGHSFSVTGGSTRKLSLAFRVAVVMLFAVAFCLLGYGITRRSFVFEFGGLAGHLLGDKKTSDFSLLSIGSSIPASVPNGYAVYLLQASYYFYTVATPFAALAGLLFLMVLPLSPKQQATMLALTETANAWSAIEVFVLSIIAALFEVSQFSQFIVGSRCDFLDEVLKHNHLPVKPICFSVDCSIRANSLFLIVGAVVHTVLLWVLIQLVRVCVDERLGKTHLSTQVPPWIVSNFLVVEEQEESTLPIVTEGMEMEPRDVGEDWDDSHEEDPDWKVWKETTNVT